MRITEINISKKNIAILFCIILVGFVIYQTSNILMILLLSILIAYILNPIVNFIERIGIPRLIGTMLLIAIILSIVLFTLALLLPTIIQDIIYFGNNIPKLIASIFNLIEKVTDYFGINVSFDIIKNYIIERIGIISRYLVNTITTAAYSVKQAVAVMLNLFLIPVLVFFLLKDFLKVKNFFNKVVKRLKLEKVIGYASEFEKLIGRYFRGMFLVGLILSALYTIVLIVIGIKGGILLGILTGMGGMIPYVGFAIGIITSLIVAAIQFQDFIHPLYVLIGFTIVQVLESTVITPKIVGDSLGLNPVLVIIGLMIGGALFGLIGMILALPVAAFIKIMISKYFFKEDVPSDFKKDDDHNKNI